MLGLKPSEKQLEYGENWYTADQLAITKSVIENKRTMVKSCNGGGKTFWDALLALWLHNSGYRVLITASTLAQANAGVGAEIRRLKALGPPGLSGKWADVELSAKFDDLHEMVTFSVQVGTMEEIAGSAAGRHYDRMALIIDEANSVSPKLIEQVDRICLHPNDVIVATLNPTPPSCYIRKAARVGNLWNTVTINGYNHPNVKHDDPDIIPGAITREFIEDQLRKAGGNRSHFYFAPPVLGEFADFSSDSLIQEVWVQRAMDRWESHFRQPDYRGTALGNDVAGTGGDASSMWGMKDWKLFRPMISESFCKNPENRRRFPTLVPGPTWMRGRGVQETVDMVEGAIWCIPDVRAVALDASGLGDGPVGQLQRKQPTFPPYTKAIKDARLVQRLEEERCAVIGYKFGQRPIEPASRKFKKFKDQLLWNLAEALRTDMFDIPPPHIMRSYGLGEDVDVMEELTRPIYGVDSSGHLIIADKAGAECADDDMRKRCASMPTTSPNELHAIALTLWQFMHLRPGPKPIETTLELRQAEFEAQKRKDIKARQQRMGPAKRGKLPWHLGRPSRWT